MIVRAFDTILQAHDSLLTDTGFITQVRARSPKDKDGAEVVPILDTAGRAGYRQTIVRCADYLYVGRDCDLLAATRVRGLA